MRGDDALSILTLGVVGLTTFAVFAIAILAVFGPV